MSLVTSVVLVVDHYPLPDSALVQAITAPIASDARGQNLNLIQMDDAGGFKFMEVAVYAAGLNYVSIEEVKDFLSGIDWDGHAARALIECNGERLGSWRNAFWVEFGDQEGTE